MPHLDREHPTPFDRQCASGPGIRPSRTSSSNLLAEMPMYIAASSRERPRRGIGRTEERAAERVMLLSTAVIWHGIARVGRPRLA